MAEKRAFVSAVLMSTGASDIFTQDIEDFPELVGVSVMQAGPIQKVVKAQEAQRAPATGEERQALPADHRRS